MWADAIPPAIAWTATGYKIGTLRGRPAPSLAGRALVGTLFWLALATTIFAPPVYRLVDETTGVPNLAILLAQTCGLIVLWPARSLLVYQRHDSDVARRIVRRRYRYLPVCIAAQVGLWMWAAVPDTDPQYVLNQADNPRAVAFFAVHHVALLVAGLDAVGPGWRIGSRMDCEFRVGLRFVAAAGLGAVALVAYNATYFTASLLGVRLAPWGDGAVIMALGLHLSTSFLAIGATVPDWGPRVLRWADSGRALHALRPMWRQLVAVTPGVAAPGSYGVFDFNSRLHRRVIEIRDASLALRRYMPAEAAVATIVEEAAVQEDVDRAAFTEAAALTAAARRKALGLPAQGDGSWYMPGAGGADLRAEAQWLTRVARCWPRARRLADHTSVAPVRS